MSKEKTIKAQASSALSGNWVTAVAGLFFVFALGLIIYLCTQLAETIFGIWTEDGMLKEGGDTVFTVIISAAVLGYVLISPVKNGFFKLCYNLSKGARADFGDLLYFFKRNNYIDTVEFNLLIAIRIIINILLALIPYFLIKAATIIFSVQLLTTVTANEIFSVINIILFILGIIIGLFLSVRLLTAEFAYIEFGNDFKTVFTASRAIVKSYKKDLNGLFYSFIAWISLCFFVLPAIYVIPYFTTSFANSSKWLLKMYKEGKIV